MADFTTLYDIAAYQSASPLEIAALATEYVSGRAITGIEKLSQRFLLELSTVVGSMQFAPTRGCIFMSSLFGGAVLTETDVINAFALSLDAIKNNLIAEETATDNPSDRYGSANLATLTLSPGLLQLYIQIYNLAGDVGSVNIPISMQPTMAIGSSSSPTLPAVTIPSSTIGLGISLS